MTIENARSIVFCLRYGIGDVVMETPILDALRGAAPAADLTVLGTPPATALLEDDPRVDAVVATDRWGLEHRWDAGDAASRAAIAAWAEHSGYDLFLDVRHAAVAVRDAIWARGLPSLDADEEAEAAAAGGADGVAAIKASVRSGWGLDVPATFRPSLHVGAADRRFAHTFLHERLPAFDGVYASGPIGLSPVGSLPMKRWPIERFANVGDWVIEETGRPLLVFYGPQHELGAAILAAMRHPARALCVGPMHLGRVAALLARCALFIGNDTGLLHVAAALGTPTVGIFGPTAPEIFLPPVSNATAVGGHDVPCPHRRTDSLHPPGCWNSDHCLIADRSCVSSVGVPEVLAAVRQALATPETSPRRPPASE